MILSDLLTFRTTTSASAWHVLGGRTFKRRMEFADQNIYCACSPLESQAAYRFLRDQGYRNDSVMEEGFPGWAKRGYPLEH